MYTVIIVELLVRRISLWCANLNYNVHGFRSLDIVEREKKGEKCLLVTTSARAKWCKKIANNQSSITAIICTYGTDFLMKINQWASLGDA